MAKIKIELSCSNEDQWSCKVEAPTLSGLWLDKDGLVELIRVLRHCQQVIDPAALRPISDFSEDVWAASVEPSKVCFPPPPARPNPVDKELIDEGPERTELWQKFLNEQSGANPPSGPGKTCVHAGIADEADGSDGPDEPDEPIVETPVVVPVSDIPADPLDLAASLPSKPIPEEQPQKPTVLDMLNRAVAKKTGLENGRNNRKPLKYNSAIREDWPDNPHKLGFTALTHPLPGLQKKMMKVLRDYAVPDTGFGAIELSDKKLAKLSGLSISSVRGTLNGLEKKGLIECAGGSGGKIWVY